MRKNKTILHSFFNVVTITTLVFLSSVIKNHLDLPELKIDPEKDEINFHEDFYKVINLGQKRMISSLLWTHTMLFSDHSHVDWKNGEISWMYHRFNTISLIDSSFYENYLFGGKYLNIVKYDLYGSEILLQKGLRKFNDSIDIGFQLGFNLIFDQKKKDLGINIWKRFLNHKKIKTEYSLMPFAISKVLKSNDDKETYIEILKAQYNQLPDESPLKEFYLKQIKKAQRN